MVIRNVTCRLSSYGGNPDGYVMCEQVDWIKQQIEQAENDETVKYIVLFAHKPMFPNGKHQIDCPIKPISPPTALEHRTWHMVCGGGGRPTRRPCPAPGTETCGSSRRWATFIDTGSPRSGRTSS